jgi:methylated-DNA-[protein]-cysteine S-methyltransferase
MPLPSTHNFLSPHCHWRRDSGGQLLATTATDAHKHSTQAYVSKIVGSPVGELTLVGNDAGLAAVLWPSDSPRRVPLGTVAQAAKHPVLVETARQLAEYFAGTRTEFALPLAFVGTAFQQRVWSALLTIPFGETRTYTDIARQIGASNAVRAVGAANGRNPISIVAPCHRVLGIDGKLHGFAGGLEMKARLLEHEGVRAAARALPLR